MALTDIDRRLLKQCLTRAPGAWKDFVDRFIGLFVHVIRHTAHSRSIKITNDDIDDYCSEVFLKLIEHDYVVLRRFREQCSLATYLSVVARRIVVKEMIRRRKAEAWGHVDAHGAALESAAKRFRMPQLRPSKRSPFCSSTFPSRTPRSFGSFIWRGRPTARSAPRLRCRRTRSGRR